MHTPIRKNLAINLFSFANCLITFDRLMEMLEMGVGNVEMGSDQKYSCENTRCYILLKLINEILRNHNLSNH